MLEIPGKDSAPKAAILADRLKAVFRGREELRVANPTKMVELRLSGLDDPLLRRKSLAQLRDWRLQDREDYHRGH